MTLSSMKMSQCGSITDRPLASEEARGQESVNNKTTALSGRLDAAPRFFEESEVVFI